MRSLCLLNSVVVCSIESTTTNEGNRNPNSCGIFLPKIHFLHVPQNWGALSYAELAVRLISRNKADYIRANKASYSFVAVETLSHPIKGDKSYSSLTKTNDTMTNSTPTSSFAPISPKIGQNRREKSVISYEIIVKTHGKKINLGRLTDKTAVLSAAGALLDNHEEVTVIKGSKDVSN